MHARRTATYVGGERARVLAHAAGAHYRCFHEWYARAADLGVLPASWFVPGGRWRHWRGLGTYSSTAAGV
jgi:hypothetical protein